MKIRMAYLLANEDWRAVMHKDGKWAKQIIELQDN